jgi:hypothetical protein
MEVSDRSRLTELSLFVCLVATESKESTSSNIFRAMSEIKVVIVDFITFGQRMTSRDLNSSTSALHPELSPLVT